MSLHVAIPRLSPSELGKIAGPLLLALLLGWGLLGVLSVQVYMYYLAFPKDSRYIKALVCVTYIIEFGQAILFAQSGFRTFAYGFGNLVDLNMFGTLWFSVPILSGIVAFIAQSFYAFRISVLAQNKYASAIIMLLAFLQLAAALASGVLAKQSVLVSRFLKTETYITAGIWEGGSALCDVVIAACMTYYLQRRREYGVKRTRTIIENLIRLTIGTGTLTATVAVVSLILTFLHGGPAYYQTAVGVLGKMYSNAMMVSLNSRMKTVTTKGKMATITTHELDIPSSQNMDRSTSQFEMQTFSTTSGRDPTNVILIGPKQ